MLVRISGFAFENKSALVAHLGRQRGHLELPIGKQPAVPTNRPVDAGRGRGQEPPGPGRMAAEPFVDDGGIRGGAAGREP